MELVQVNFRMPLDLKQNLEASAIEHGRSLTQEFVYKLDNAIYLEQQLDKLNNQNTNKIYEYNDSSQPMMSIHLNNVTIGLMSSQFTDIRLQKNFNNDDWTLSYHGLRCTIDKVLANELLTKGCTLIP